MLIGFFQNHGPESQEIAADAAVAAGAAAGVDADGVDALLAVRVLVVSPLCY